MVNLFITGFFSTMYFIFIVLEERISSRERTLNSLKEKKTRGNTFKNNEIYVEFT